jgi:hypothetical protein
MVATHNTLPSSFLDLSDRQLYKQLIDSQDSKIDAMQAEINALKLLVSQHHQRDPMDLAVADKPSAFSFSRIGKRPRIQTVTLEWGSTVLPSLQNLIDDARAERLRNAKLDDHDMELNGLILDALPQWFQEALLHHFKVSHEQLLSSSFDDMCTRLLEFGLETDHKGRYATFFQRHGSIRAAIMSRSSLNGRRVSARAPGGSHDATANCLEPAIDS